MDSKKKKYLDRIVEHLVNATKYDTDHLNVYIIKFPFSNGWEVFGSHGEMSDIYDISPERFGIKRWDFDQYMIDVFDLIEHEADYVWEEYFKGARFFGNEYAKSDGLINESVDKQKEYIDKVLDRLVRNTKIDDKKVTFPFAIFKQEELTGDSLLSVSIWIDGRWENHKYPQRFEKYVNDNYGVTYEESVILWRRYMEIIEKEIVKRFKPDFESIRGVNIWDIGRHNINESGDKQKKLLDYVYNDLVKNTKFRDASYKDIDIYDGKCKSLQVGIRWGSVAPYFNYVPECLENFLKDTYGLTYNEIQDLFWDKYEQHIINMVLSKKENISPHVRVHVDYLRESKLTEGVDLGFVDKVVDSVLKEIVWDFDRGIVYFPMIDYSGFLSGDGDFLAPLNADDPFSNRFSEMYQNTNWHNDLMNHIEDTYGITGNEWNRVWGSLQGEIWEKTEEYWDSFPKGY